ncbi:MAG: ABC transporter substrate binding protein [Sideroxydans sp.]|nr:ABC transporter substrate binding protein [Sideroxydans sp.]
MAALLCIAFISGATAAEAKRVLLLLSDQNAAYQHYRKALEQNLPADVHLEVLSLAQQTDLPSADILVTAGSGAAQWAADRWHGAMLAGMLSSKTFQQMRSGKMSASPVSALFLDQPLVRQVALVRATLPSLKRVGVLYTPASDFVAQPLQRELAKQGAQLVTMAVKPDDNLSGRLDELLAQSDILLAVPDSTIYNSSTIRNILLGSYRRGIPMVGLSAAYVSAGALCAVYSTPEQLAAQSAAMVSAFLHQGAMPVPQFPKLYQIALNAEVARSMRFNIRSAEALRIEIDRVEGGGK